MTKAKKLTLTDIKNETKVYEEKQKVELSDGVFVNIYPNFSPTKISEYIREIVTDPIRAKEVGIDFDGIALSDWSMFNVICKFTDLGIPTDIEKKVDVFLMFADSKRFWEILSSFPAESIAKLTEAANNFKDNQELLKVAENTQ